MRTWKVIFKKTREKQLIIAEYVFIITFYRKLFPTESSENYSARKKREIIMKNKLWTRAIDRGTCSGSTKTVIQIFKRPALHEAGVVMKNGKYLCQACDYAESQAS